MRPLRSGFILEVARAAGLEIKPTWEKARLSCPFHDDRHPSAVVILGTNCFCCAVCTPDGGLSAKAFAERLGVDWRRLLDEAPGRPGGPRATRGAPATEFSAAAADTVWRAALARARDDEAVDAELEVYSYLRGRGLLEAWELGVFGLLPPEIQHPAIRAWRARGYRVVLPLFDSSGRVRAVQARAINDSKPKTIVPSGSSITGTLFADRAGQRVLAGERVERIVFGEGLTDLLALAIASPFPVVTAPGTSLAAGAVGPWATGIEVLLGLDRDAAGDAARPAVVEALYVAGARRVRLVRWPDSAKDACDVIASRGARGLHEFLSKAGAV